MKKILLIPDSFKGTMSSARICTLMKEAVEDIFPGCETVAVPVADGGEGSVDAFLEAVGGEKIFATVKNPFFEDMEGFYGILDSKTGGTEKTAVVEMAVCAGLPLAMGRLSPRITTTYGAGQLIAAALQEGCKNIIIGLGGSATNDAGCGAAAALGVEFFGKDGKSFVPAGGTLKDIEHIDISKAGEFLKGCTLTAMCDIDNPLYGTNGAAYIFGPQKGADEKTVQELDAGLRHLAKIVQKDLGIDKADYPGAGAAGGMGYGMLCFLGAELKPGIETVLDATDFDRKLKGANFVFTGEGKIDSQSLRGKVVVGVARRAKKAGVPVIAVVGDAEANLDAVYDTGVTTVFSINRLAVPFSEAKKTAEADLSATMRDILRLIRAAV